MLTLQGFQTKVIEDIQGYLTRVIDKGIRVQRSRTWMIKNPNIQEYQIMSIGDVQGYRTRIIGDIQGC